VRGFVALEDVSIVVPIAVAIILFFAALAWAISTVQKTNGSTDLTLKLIDIADVFTSPGVLTKSAFSQLCGSAMTIASGYGFCAYITSPTSPTPLRSASGAALHCGACDSIPKHVTVLSRAFPIPLQTQYNGLPYNDVNLLVVAVWQGG